MYPPSRTAHETRGTHGRTAQSPVEQPAFIHHDLPKEPPKRPPLILAPIWLFFRPRNFFLHYVTEPVAALTAAFAFVLGLARAMDRVDIQVAEGKLTFAADSWAVYWMMVLFSGCIGGLIYFYLGGWWYRVRLKWSGAQEADAQLARRTYLYASQVLAIPLVLITVIDSFRHLNPMEAIQSEEAWRLIVFIFPFWSIFASFRGARAIFDIGFFRALIWFAILPAIYFFLAIALVIAMFAFTPAAADTSSRNSFENSIFSFEYPGNWYMDLGEDIHDHESYLWLDTAADAYVTFEIYEPSGSPTQELGLAIEVVEEQFGETTRIGTPARSWGRYGCVEQQLTFSIDFNAYKARVIVLSLSEDTNVDITQVWKFDQEEYINPGFDLIKNTFVAK